MPKQPPPELLSAPPALRPFGIVTQDPSLKTPAGKAGLALGDALLSFGSARHLRDVQSVLMGSVGTPVPVVCIGADGRTFRKYVVPAQWDPSAPKSLLGCQMSNQCPADHPAITRRSANGKHVTAATPASALATPVRTCWARIALVCISLLQICVALSIIGLPSVSPGAADLLRLTRLDKCAAPNASRRALQVANRTVLAAANVSATFPTAHADPAVAAAAAAAAAATPAPPPLATTAAITHSEATTETDAKAGAAAEANAATLKAATRTSPGAVSDSATARSEHPKPLANVTATAQEMLPHATKPAAAGAPIAEPEQAAAAADKPAKQPQHSQAKPGKHHPSPPTATSPSPPPTTTATSPPPIAVPLPQPSQQQRATTEDVATEAVAPATPSAAASTSPPPAGGLGGASFGNSGLGLLTTGHVDPSAGGYPGGALGHAHLLSTLQLDGQLDMKDMVLGVFVACCVLVLIALLGLAVACSRPSTCVRTSATLLYFVTSLPVAAALGFAVAFCLVFRSEAEHIVRRYWLCLLLTEPKHMNGAARTAWGAAAAVYQSVTLAAMLLLGCTVLLLAGLYAASKIIGPAVIAKHMLNVINCGQLLVGAGLCAVAAGLHARADGSVHADAALLVLGASVLAMSSLGLLASRVHSCPCLLRLYGVLAMLVTLALVAFVGGLALLGVKGISDLSFLEANWHYVHQVYPLSKEDFLRLLRNHWSKLLIAGSLLAAVQLLVLTATCTLRRALLGVGGGKEKASASERAGLITNSDDDLD